MFVILSLHSRDISRMLR